MEYDYLVIAGYFALMVAISLLFKKMASNSTSDYFRGAAKCCGGWSVPQRL